MMVDYRRQMFPAALILLNLGAALMSFKAHDWRRFIYWIASAACLASVAFSSSS